MATQDTSMDGYTNTAADLVHLKDMLSHVTQFEQRVQDQKMIKHAHRLAADIRALGNRLDPCPYTMSHTEATCGRVQCVPDWDEYGDRASW